MSYILGIDLGTTNSVMSCLKADEPEIIPNKNGHRITPSVFAINNKNEEFVGQTAKNMAVINADRVVNSIKRSMGSDKAIRLNNHKFTPEEVSAKILSKLKADAEEFLGEKIEKAVITVPAYFNETQRKATKDAGKIANLDVLRIVNEPTAACLAYGLKESDEQLVIVYDLGGGTFDISVIEIGDGVFEVRSTCGDNSLGGNDFDNRIVEFLVEEFKKENSIDLSKDNVAMQKLLEEAEKAKIELSENSLIDINIPFITADENGPKHIQVELTRAKFEDLIEDYIQKTVETLNQAIEDADVEIDEIDKILLVGGSTRIPAIRQSIKDAIGIEPYTGLNPDEVVSLGAAIQTGIISGEIKDIALVDVTPISFGVEAEHGKFVKIIEKNSTIPCDFTKMFSTTVDNQKTVEIHVLQGESEFINTECVSLGKFELTNLERRKSGEPKIEVKFDIDVDGILHVSANDIETGINKIIDIKVDHGLSDDDIDRLKKKAENEKKDNEDSKKNDDFVNTCEKIVIKTKKIISNLEETIEKDDLEIINRLIVDVESNITNKNIEKLEIKIKELEDKLNNIISE